MLLYVADQREDDRLDSDYNGVKSQIFFYLRP